MRLDDEQVQVTNNGPQLCCIQLAHVRHSCSRVRTVNIVQRCRRHGCCFDRLGAQVEVDVVLLLEDHQSNAESVKPHGPLRFSPK